MLVNQLLFVTLIFFSLLSPVVADRQKRTFGTGKIVFSERQVSINVEVAKSRLERKVGLMHRNYLATNAGMLFIFDKTRAQKVWMRNTLIPLDVLFISREGKIVSLIENLQPCVKSPCEIYGSGDQAKYMLEVNAGFVKKFQIEKGQSLVLVF